MNSIKNCLATSFSKNFLYSRTCSHPFLQKTTIAATSKPERAGMAPGQFSIPEAGPWGARQPASLSTPQIEAAQNIRAGVARLLQLAKGPQLVDRFVQYNSLLRVHPPQQVFRMVQGHRTLLNFSVGSKDHAVGIACIADLRERFLVLVFPAHAQSGPDMLGAPAEVLSSALPPEAPRS